MILWKTDYYQKVKVVIIFFMNLNAKKKNLINFRVVCVIKMKDKYLIKEAK